MILIDRVLLFNNGWIDGRMDESNDKTCFNCLIPLNEDEDSMCDECFSRMPMDIWTTIFNPQSEKMEKLKW